MAYLLESSVLVVGLDSEEVNQRIHLPDIVHHWRTRETEPVCGLEGAASLGCNGDSVLDALRFIKENTIESALGAQKREKFSHWRFIVFPEPLILLLLKELLEAAKFSPQGSVGRQNNIVGAEVVPTQLSSLAMNHVRA